MKILVNVTQERLNAGWMNLGTGGFRFIEQGDGSFDLHLTTDLALLKRRHAALEEALDPDIDGRMPTI